MEDSAIGPHAWRILMDICPVHPLFHADCHFGAKRWVGQERWFASHSWGISIWVDSQNLGVMWAGPGAWCGRVSGRQKSHSLQKKCLRTGIPKYVDNIIHGPIEQLMYHQVKVTSHLSFCPSHCTKGKIPALAHLSDYFPNSC